MPRRVRNIDTGVIVYVDSLKPAELYARAADGDQYLWQPTDEPVKENR